MRCETVVGNSLGRSFDASVGENVVITLFFIIASYGIVFYCFIDILVS